MDSGGWIWSKGIKSLSWQQRGLDSRDKSQADYEAKMKALKWRRENMPLGENKYLNEIALGMKENERMYLLLIARMMQGYFPDQTNEEPTSLHFQRRFDNYLKLKQWFKFDKTVCDSDLPELSGRAPWMDVALREAKNYGGKNEENIDQRIREYHKDGGGNNGGYKTPWCASFVNWCILNSGFEIFKSAGSQSFLWSDKVEKCDEFYGAIAVFTDCDSSGKSLPGSKGHATFVFGKLKNGTHCVLGGNQGDKLKVSKYDCSGAVFHSYASVYKKFRGFYKPKNYNVKENDKLTNLDVYDSIEEANLVAVKMNIVSSNNGENSQ